jgi:hypothetical protein
MVGSDYLLACAVPLRLHTTESSPRKQFADWTGQIALEAVPMRTQIFLIAVRINTYIISIISYYYFGY